MAKTELKGRVVAITGAARGIGRATAEACAKAGMRVAICDLDERLAATAAAQIGGGAIGLAVDVRDRDAFSSFLDTTEEQLGELYAIVNNAGVIFVDRFAEQDPARVQLALDVNIGGVMTGTQLALERFLPRRSGHVVNIASLAGQIGVPGGAVYCATKHAVVGFTRALRGEVEDAGVRTTIVMPGVIQTEMTTGFGKGRAARTIKPPAVGKAVVRALARGTREVFVPRELGGVARLVTGLPPRPSEAIKKALAIERVMLGADHAARATYERDRERV